MIRIATMLVLAALLRLYGINWDQGFHLHPDERQLIFVADKIHFFDNLNPDFFNYGTLPIYILKGVSQLCDILFGTHLANYTGMLYVGRILSTSVDLLTIYLVYKIALLIFKKERLALFSSFFYAVSFFTIQNSHFFIVDTFLTFFITALFYLLLTYVKKPELKKVFWMSLTFAAAVTTKITAIIFLPLIVMLFIIDSVKRHSGSSRIRFLASLGMTGGGFALFSFIFSFIFMPYAYLDYQKFLTDVLLQIKLNSDPYIFPYTLQYVYTLPYLHYLKNIFLWGLGPIIGSLAIIGLLTVILNLFQDLNQIPKQVRNDQSTMKQFNNVTMAFFLFFFLFYFLIIGRSAVKFMRYMLPIYPFLAILAGVGLMKLAEIVRIKRVSVGLILICCLLWTFAFLSIYSQKHTRIAASEWINQNIPSGSTLAIEHWDDRLPLFGQEKYNFVELTLYDQPDDENKWQIMNQKLKTSDYIVLASNRLYVPLQKLSDCTKYKLCYPKTAQYYQNLFAGENVLLGSEATPGSADSGRARMTSTVRFQKTAEFTVNPMFSLLGFTFQIDDQSADESFTVYDHPKVIIFKKLR